MEKNDNRRVTEICTKFIYYQLQNSEYLILNYTQKNYFGYKGPVP